MMIFIIGIILFFIEYSILKDTKSLTAKHGSYVLNENSAQPVKLKIWQWALLIIGNIGILSLFTIIGFILVYIKKVSKDTPYYKEYCTYWRYRNPLYLSILKFLNKKL